MSLDWLRGRVGSADDESEDGGCGRHHFGEYTEGHAVRSSVVSETRYVGEDTGDVYIEWNRNDNHQPRAVSETLNREHRRRVVLERRYVAMCEHEGCRERDYEWREIGSVLVSEVEGE